MYKILSKRFSQTEAFWIALIFLLLPLNSAKTALINAPTIYLLALFFGAFYMLSEYLENPKSILYRLSITLLFFVSFFLNSLLVLYAIVPLYMLYMFIRIEIHSLKPLHILTQGLKFIIKYIDLIVLPIVFFELKSRYFSPSELYGNYNKIVIEVDPILDLLYRSLTTSVYDPFLQMVHTGLHYWYLVPLVLIPSLLVFRHKDMGQTSWLTNIMLILMGSLAYVLAVFPYLAVRKLPQLDGWESRHQILIPVGLALILYGVISLSAKIHRYPGIVISSLLITLLMLQNLSNGYGYLKDWYYQIALEENFKASATIERHSTFVVDIRLDHRLANKRHISFYENNNRLKKIFSDEKRFMVSKENEINKYRKYQPYRQYGFSAWQYEKPVYLTIVPNKIYENKSLYFLKMLYFQFTDQRNFRMLAKQLIIMKTEKEPNVQQ